tara:strand:- start:8380 stop:8835 length:456 start_codon:yes stop_codon:yes gene_type:complete
VNGDNKYIESFAMFKEGEKLCKEKGISMGVIMMPYYKNSSLNDYKEVDKKIIEKILKNYAKIYNETGFIHGDFFPKNIIMDDKKNPIFIDFELSFFDKGNNLQFWRDITDFLSIIKYSKNLDQVIKDHCIMNTVYNKEPTKNIIDKLIEDL